ncbi:MAG: hypothetical protein LHV68_03360 [Elusimicrobia bacterium]|nr:hypothetical protein [Candidatus Liberimonas magnetica]
MNNKRRQYLIDKDFQLPFIVRNIIHILIYAVLIFLIVIGWNRFQCKQDYLMLTPDSDKLQAWAAKNNVAPDSITYACQFIVQAKEYTFTRIITKPLLAAVLINALVSIVTNLYFSHRIAGPVFKIKKALRDKIEGKEVRPIQLRKHDYFTELADMTNEAFGFRKRQDGDIV